MVFDDGHRVFSSQQGCGWDQSAGRATNAAVRMPRADALTCSAQPSNPPMVVAVVGSRAGRRCVDGGERSPVLRSTDRWSGGEGVRRYSVLWIRRPRCSGRLEDRAGGRRDAVTTPGTRQLALSQAPSQPQRGRINPSDRRGHSKQCRRSSSRECVAVTPTLIRNGPEHAQRERTCPQSSVRERSRTVRRSAAPSANRLW